MEKHYYQGTGRRKVSVARVRLFPSESADFLVNDRDVQDYFGPRDFLHREMLLPLDITDNMGKFKISVHVRGGGIVGQAGAIRHGIARALLDFDDELRPALKKAGLLTRDARVKERKKAGLKRARKRPQYTKR
ncbi:MAG: 30S ribosomal protein S9 [Chloroflexaceae bacterium]|nr:30S ribosomal protein S9 [Chloroflexaceae bacterium]